MLFHSLIYFTVLPHGFVLATRMIHSPQTTCLPCCISTVDNLRSIHLRANTFCYRTQSKDFSDDIHGFERPFPFHRLSPSAQISQSSNGRSFVMSIIYLLYPLFPYLSSRQHSRIRASLVGLLPLKASFMVSYSVFQSWYARQLLWHRKRRSPQPPHGQFLILIILSYILVNIARPPPGF